MTVFAIDGWSVAVLVGFVGLTVAAAKLYDSKPWAPLAGLVAALAYFFVAAILSGGGRYPQPVESSRLHEAVVATRSFVLPVTLAMLGIWLARRRSVGFRVALGLGLALFVTPLLLFALVFVALWGKGASP